MAEINVRASAADVDDSVHQFHTPQLASWFAVPQLVDPSEIGVTQIWSEQLGRLRPVQPGEHCYVGFACLPMGWSWALRFLPYRSQPHRSLPGEYRGRRGHPRA